MASMVTGNAPFCPSVVPSSCLRSVMSGFVMSVATGTWPNIATACTSTPLATFTRTSPLPAMEEICAVPAATSWAFCAVSPVPGWISTSRQRASK